MQTTTISPLVAHEAAKGLGYRQVECLRYIGKHGLSGSWGKPAESRKMIDSLLRRGLIDVPVGDNAFRLTDKGRAAVAAFEGASFIVKRSA